MRISVQTETFDELTQALTSSCDDVRFGSEFCEWKLPDLSGLKKARDAVKDSGKTFTYITPRVSNANLEKLETQLRFLNDENPCNVVVNDLGVLDLLSDYRRLKPRLGRQLVYMPARCPWKQITATEVDFWSRRRVEKIFYQTSLNYSLTGDFFKRFGVENIDVDWIPRSLPYFDSLIQQAFVPSIYLYFVLVTLTRKCHTARFLGERTPESCSKPCLTRSFFLKQRALDVEFYLIGNAVFRLVEPSNRDLNRLAKRDVETILMVNAVSTLYPVKNLDKIIYDLAK